MAGAKEKIKKHLMENVGKEVDRETLSKVAGTQDWTRALRTLRQETGLDIKATNKGYILTSLIPVQEPKVRKEISSKLRYAVLQRDNSTCQRCGANIYNTPNVKLDVDHKIPVELGGLTVIDNLWTLCSNCNGGKQAFFTDKNTEELSKIMKMNSAAKRLESYFRLYPNIVIEPVKLQAIANVRDWARTLRKIREEKNMNIKWIRPNEINPEGGYIFIPDK